jgi:ferredoxin
MSLKTDGTNERPVTLDAGRCKGCQACADILPEVFGWDETGEKVFLKQDSAPEEDLQRCIIICPARCIDFGDE